MESFHVLGVLGKAVGWEVFAAAWKGAREFDRYKATGIRLDSGDLAYLSIESRKYFRVIEKEFCVPGFGNLLITASNDLNEETIDALNKQGHEVDAFGIGTYLVTCYSQAALGCVFKLVEINGQPRIKLSEDVSKVTIPCKKRCYRLYGREGYALLDLMTGENEAPPKEGERILCRHPFSESKRAYVVPHRVEELLKCYWSGASYFSFLCLILKLAELFYHLIVLYNLFPELDAPYPKFSSLYNTKSVEGHHKKRDPFLIGWQKIMFTNPFHSVQILTNSFCLFGITLHVIYTFFILEYSQW
ncbi:hypothetical protein M5K25_006850 [Dendrobium thyrsiflorum]|uniref:nicotinate phosphoribosyltransferase n=1 Tax=Dendrobium thyrsiflorum TaxID=117978 RepID=A0ABD0VJF0_DENTH